MSAVLRELAKEWGDRRNYPKTTVLLNRAARTALGEGAPEVFGLEDVPKRIEIRKGYPEIPLEKDLAEQREIILEGVVRPLGLNVDNALRQLSFQFPERKPSYDAHINVPLIVPQFEGIPWLAAVDAAGFYVSTYLRGELRKDNVHPWIDPRGVEIPQGVHGRWVQDGSVFVERKPIDVRDELQVPKHAVLQAEGLWTGFALGLLRWDVARNKGWDLIGDGVGSGSVPYLGGWGDGPSFGADFGGGAYPGGRSLVGGR